MKISILRLVLFIFSDIFRVRVVFGFIRGKDVFFIGVLLLVVAKRIFYFKSGLFV